MNCGMRKHIHQIADLIDDDTRAVLGVKPRSVRLARERACFPASWYAVIRQLCEKHDVDCPLCLFTFKGDLT